MNSESTITKISSILLVSLMLFSAAVFSQADEEILIEREHSSEQGVSSHRLLEERLGELSPEDLKEYLIKKEEMRVEEQFNPFNSTPIVPILVLAIIFGMPVAIIAMIGFFKYKRRKLLHETVRTMVEKGVDIPPHLFEEEGNRAGSPFNKGIVLISIGLGLIFFFLFSGEGHGVGIGMIPLFVGLAYLIIWKLEKNQNNLDQN